MRSTLKPRDLLLEAAFLEQHLVGGHEHFVEMQLGPLLAGHEGGGLTASDAWAVGLDQDGADAAHARAEAHVDEEHVARSPNA